MASCPSDLETILSRDALRWAWRRVRENRGSAGGDGVTINRFAHHLEVNLFELGEEVRTGRYVPGPVRYVLVYQRGKPRRLAILCVRDRVLQRAVLDYLTPLVDPGFLTSSYGYRPGLSLHGAVERIVRLRNRGLTHVVDADIHDCFGSLDHALLMRALVNQAPGVSRQLLALVKTWIEMPQRPRQDRRDLPRRIGIPQGAPISPLLCNIYLHQFDDSLNRRRLLLVRYADDFVVLARSPEQADRALRTVVKILRGIKLRIHPGKTAIRSFEEGFDFLGVHFEGNAYSYDIEGRHFVIEGLPPVWFHEHPEEYA